MKLIYDSKNGFRIDITEGNGLDDRVEALFCDMDAKEIRGQKHLVRKPCGLLVRPWEVVFCKDYSTCGKKSPADEEERFATTSDDVIYYPKRKENE